MTLRFTGSDERDRQAAKEYIDKLSTEDFKRFKEVMEVTSGGLNGSDEGNTIIPGCKMGAKAKPSNAGYIKVTKDWVAASGGNGFLDVYSCTHADVFSCTPYDDLAKQKLEGHVVTLCGRCTKKAEEGAIVVDAESGCTLEVIEQAAPKSSRAKSRAFAKAMREGRTKDAGELIYKP